jgi:hypothetical protein
MNALTNRTVTRYGARRTFVNTRSAETMAIALAARLRREQPIEWIAMMKRHVGHGRRGFERDGQQTEPVDLELLLHEAIDG